MKFDSPNNKTPEKSEPEMQYENLRKPIWETKESNPRFIPINPVVFTSSSELLLKPESMHPNIVSGFSDPPILNVSDARFPSDDDASAYDRTAWQRFLESHEAGMEKSWVRVVQVGDEQVMGEYEVDRLGSKAGWEIRVLLQ